jgi:DUF971 family protein
MNPKHIQQIQNEFAIVWDDGSESYVSLEKLRYHCPCAACAGEADVLGHQYRGPPVPLKPESFILKQFQSVGGYALSFQWGDGHGTGIYSFELLKKLGG